MSAVLEHAQDSQSLSITLQMDEKVRAQLRQGEGAIAIAESFVLDPTDPASDEIAVLANDELISIRARAAQIEKLRVGFVAPARQIIENAQALFKPALASLERAEHIIKQRLLGWQHGKKHIAEEARQKVEAEARKARQEAEARAAAERARAEEQAREARQRAEAAEAERKRRAEEAERLRREGDAKAAAEAERKAKAAAAEQAKQEERQHAATENGEAKARQIQLEAAAAPAPAPIPEATKLAGFGSRDNWSAEIEPGKTEDDVKLAIALAIADGRTDLLTLLKLDMSAAKKLAAAQKQLMKVPGLKAINKPIGTSRG